MSRFYHLTISIILFKLIVSIGITEHIPSPTSKSTEANTGISWKQSLIDSLGIPAPAIDYAINGYLALKQGNRLKNDSLIAIVDFSKPSVDKRLFILDIKNQKLIKKTLVAHGVNSGEDIAESFSNKVNSNQSSLGLYITQDTYMGKHGYSLRLQGLNKGLNDNAYKRAVVIHGANYVSESFIERNGRLGRSFGCPALPPEETQEVIDLIKDGTCLYIYHPKLNAISPTLQGTSL